MMAHKDHENLSARFSATENHITNKKELDESHLDFEGPQILTNSSFAIAKSDGIMIQSSLCRKYVPQEAGL